MAIKSRSVSPDGTRVMTLEEFKRWLKKYDADADGRISKEELQDIIRITGGWFSRWRSRQAVSCVDANGDGFIDDNEISNLLEFAKKQLGVTVVAF
ncbi:uncharacterized protein J3R85_004561 [Psidium guajava]|nr:uncharacterized protein J3R85_004561 [Psidium guajava]